MQKVSPISKNVIERRFTDLNGHTLDLIITATNSTSCLLNFPSLVSPSDPFHIFSNLNVEMRSRKSRKRVTTEEVRVVGTGKIVRKFLRYIDRLINSGNFVSYKVIMD